MTTYIQINKNNFQPDNFDDILSELNPDDKDTVVLSNLRTSNNDALKGDRNKINHSTLSKTSNNVQELLLYYCKLTQELDQQSSEEEKGNEMTVDPAILIGFLVEIGRWAKNELSERWKVRREQQAADLTQKAQVDAAIPTMLQAAANTSSPQRVQETIDLIERKRDAINRAQNAKISDREEYDAQKLIKSALEQRTKEHDKLIRQMLDEIESDLNNLGFEVERESA